PPVTHPLSLHDALPICDALERSLETTEQLVRVTATNLHGEAQRREKLLHLPEPKTCVAKPNDPPDILGLYGRAADAYEQYLSARSEEHTSELQSLAYLV